MWYFHLKDAITFDLSLSNSPEEYKKIDKTAQYAIQPTVKIKNRKGINNTEQFKLIYFAAIWINDIDKRILLHIINTNINQIKSTITQIQNKTQIILF